MVLFKHCKEAAEETRSRGKQIRKNGQKSRITAVSRVGRTAEAADTQIGRASCRERV